MCNPFLRGILRCFIDDQCSDPYDYPHLEFLSLCFTETFHMTKGLPYVSQEVFLYNNWLLADVRPFDLQHWQSWTLWKYLNGCNLSIMGSVTLHYIPNCYYLLCQCVKIAVTSEHHLNNQNRFQERTNSDKLRTESLGYTSEINENWMKSD